MSGVQIRIFSAIAIGVVMITSALVVRATHGPSETEQPNTAQASVLSERKHIKVVDSNSNNVPDWQENLIDSEPIYLDATSTEPYEPPDTVGGQFAFRYYEDLVTLQTLGMLEDTREELVNSAIAELEKQTEAPTYTEDDLRHVVTTEDPNALRAYGNLVAGTIFHYQTDEENEYQIFQRMTQDENPRHLEKLAKIEEQYDNIITALLELEVPEQYTFEHLAIVNSFSELRETVRAMQLYFEDPLHTIVRYRQLHGDVVGMNNAIHSLYDALYLDENIQFAENETLPVLVELLEKP